MFNQQQKRWVFLGHRKFEEDGRVVLKIPRDRLYTRLKIQLEVEHSNGPNAKSNPAVGAIFNAIKNFSVVINDRIKPWDEISGQGLYMRSQIDARGLPELFGPLNGSAGIQHGKTLIFDIDFTTPEVNQSRGIGLDLRSRPEAPDLIRGAEAIFNFGNGDDLWLLKNYPDGESVIADQGGLRVWAEYYTRPEAISPQARLPLRYIREQSKSFKQGDDIKYVLPKNEAIDYASVTVLAKNNQGSGVFDLRKTLSYRHGEEEIYDQITTGVLMETIRRNIKTEIDPGILHVDFFDDKDLSTALLAQSMREDIELEFTPYYDGAKTDHEIVVLEEQVRAWDFTGV